MNLRDIALVLNDAHRLAPVSSHVQLTQCSVATTLTPPTGATRLMIQANGSVDVRYTLDTSTAPTASSGFVLVHDDPPIVVSVADGVVFKMIQEAANAAVSYQWFGLPT